MFVQLSSQLFFFFFPPQPSAWILYEKQMFSLFRGAKLDKQTMCLTTNNVTEISWATSVKQAV